MKYNNEAKIIVMLRNPIDMVYSLYYQQAYNFDEDARSFNDAWYLQDIRAKGQSIPARCREPSHIQYKDVGCYSTQLKKLYKHVPREQVKVIFFDDFVRETQKTYYDVLSFLNISSDGRTEFPRINPNKIHKSKLIGSALRKNPRFVRKAKQTIKRILNIRSFHILPTLVRLNTKKIPRPPLDKDMKKILIEEFKEEIRELSQMMGKNLEHWLKR